MKLLVTSDTHGNSDNLFYVIQKHRDIETVIFLGDGLNELEDLENAYPNLKTYAVNGNCDRYPLRQDELIENFGSVMFFITHGDTYDVKRTKDYIVKRATNLSVDVVLYGHTHIPRLEEINNIKLFNPGSLGVPVTGAPSYAIITIENKEVSFELLNI